MILHVVLFLGLLASLRIAWSRDPRWGRRPSVAVRVVVVLVFIEWFVLVGHLLTTARCS